MAQEQINGSSMYFEVVGSGAPLLMMHGGLGLDHTYFRPFFDQLTDSYQVIYYDHRGNGRSERPENFEALTHQLLIDDAVALLDHLGLEKVSLFGHSYGGFLAQKFAIDHGDRLDKLILANTVPAFDYQPVPNGTEEQMAAFGAAFTRPMEDDADWQKIWSTLCQMYFKEYDAEIGDKLDAATHYSAGAWNAGSAALATFNTLEQLGGVGVSSLVVGGHHDFICPVEHGAGRISSLLPSAELAVFENSAHYPFIEEEGAFFSKVREFLG